MEVVAVSWFSAKFCRFTFLTTTGIQDGHMKMHLNNILNQFEANDDERILIRKHFKHNIYRAAADYIDNLRSNN
jgi:hydroxymethylglutaryl-CoA reductase